MTIKPDADALGAMAVWFMRCAQVTAGTEALSTCEVRHRIAEIAAYDTAASEWVPGEPIEEVSGPQALKVVSEDSRRDLLERVWTVRTWIETGAACPAEDGR